MHACVNAPIQECAFLASSQGKLMLSFLGPPLSTTVIFLFVLFSHKLCPTLCDPMDYSLPGFLCPWNFPGKNTEVGYHFLVQGIFLTQGSNPTSHAPTALAGRFFTTIPPIVSYYRSNCAYCRKFRNTNMYFKTKRK